jgi:signal transduction histidine kinase
MSLATYRVIEPIKNTPAESNAIGGEAPGNGQAFQSPGSSAFNKTTKFKKQSKKKNNTQTTSRLKTSADESGHNEPYPASQLADNLIEKAEVTDLKNTHYFLKFAIPVAVLSWFFDSIVHYFWYGELEFEIIPSDGNELWMRSTIFLLLATFGLFADFKSKTSIADSIRKNQINNISRAKKQWELVVDTLPQLVIAMDDKARITRINRTVETWGIAKVNNVNGLYVSDFLKCLNKNFTDDAWTSNWPDIWQQIKNKDLLERKVEKKHSAKTYQYTLRKIPDYDANNDQCYAVLIIDDITTRQSVEKTLKSQAQELEKKVNERTVELKQANSQLEYELQAKKTANAELKESQTSRLALLRDVFTTQENERKRIARELHDSIGQSLGATKFKLEELLIDKKNIFNADYDEFFDVVTKLQSLIQEVRHISMDLRPALLDDLGTVVTLNWFCREFENTYTGISVKQIINAQESDISEDNKVVIFRIVQEAMNNIVKHANAKNIVLELDHSASGLSLSIKDDGCGFNKDLLIKKKISLSNNDNIPPPRCSFGLSSMRERAESTSGDFFIETIANVGTRINVSWES